MKKLNASILDVEFDDPDVGETTMRKYFQALLLKLFEEEEGFSGKRPFGNSGWTSGMEAALIREGYVVGKIDEDGYIEEIDNAAFSNAVAYAINRL